MEYLRLTNGTKTIIVIDQDNPANAAWAFAIKVKEGSGRFQALDSRTNLESAVNAAIEEFRSSYGFINQ